MGRPKKEQKAEPKLPSKPRGPKPFSPEDELPEQNILKVDHAALFASSALNGLLASADESDTPESIVTAAWDMGLMMVAKRPGKVLADDKQLALPLEPGKVA